MDLRKINRGRILPNFPQICIDKFNIGSIAQQQQQQQQLEKGTNFFLTHYDDDIIPEVLNRHFLENLADETKSNVLHLHKIVFSLFKYWTSTHLYDNNQIDGNQMNEWLDTLVHNGKIVFLKTNVPMQLHLLLDGAESEIVVTPLSSGSNAGCVINRLLIETAEQRILYTGTCRLTLKDLKNCLALYNTDTGSLKKLDKIYLDTTYCLDTTTELPARSLVVDQLSQELAKLIELNEQKPYELVNSREVKINNLFCLHKLAELTRQQIHVPYHLAVFLQDFPSFKDRVGYELNLETRVHYDCADACDYEDYLPTEHGFMGHYAISCVKVDCELLYQYGCRRRISPTFDEMQYRYGKNAVYSTHLSEIPTLHGIYANSLSFYEMGRMLNYLKVDPTNVMPLVERNYLSMDEIQIALDTACDATKSMEEPLDIMEELSSCNFDFTNDVAMAITDSRKMGAWDGNRIN